MKYDPTLTSFVWGGRLMTGWKSLEASHKDERVTGNTTADGKAYVAINPSKMGTIRATFPTVNPHNSHIDKMSQSNDPQPASILDSSDSARASRGSRCWVTKHPDMDRRDAPADTDIVLELLVEDLTFGYQQDPTQDPAIQPTA